MTSLFPNRITLKTKKGSNITFEVDEITPLSTTISVLAEVKIIMQLDMSVVAVEDMIQFFKIIRAKMPSIEKTEQIIDKLSGFVDKDISEDIKKRKKIDDWEYRNYMKSKFQM